MVKKIKLLALDIDGVLTDGRTTLGARKPERKRLAFQDLDAINAAKRAGLRLALVTGESDGSVDLVAARTGIELVHRGAKDKLAALQTIAIELRISLAEICYVGDGDRDAPALAEVGLSFAPTNATFSAQSSAHRPLNRAGGHGAVNEAVRLLLVWNDDRESRQFFARELRKFLAKQRLSASQVNASADLAMNLLHAFVSGQKILLCGPGAETALGQLSKGKQNWPMVALSPNQRIQKQQLKALVRPGDMVATFSQNRSDLDNWAIVCQVVEKYIRRKIS